MKRIDFIKSDEYITAFTEVIITDGEGIKKIRADVNKQMIALKNELIEYYESAPTTPSTRTAEQTISFKKSDWDKWKAKLGEGSYQGTVGVDYIVDWLKFLEDREYAQQPPVMTEWQLCPKCLGDGHLGRYNSPNISTDACPLCDVCNGYKIIAKPFYPSSRAEEMDNPSANRNI